MAKLFVFDWNGTLLADFEAIVDSVNHELAVVKHPPITHQDYRDYYDTPTVYFFEKLGVNRVTFDANRLEMAKAFHAYYEPRVAKAHTRKGAKELLKEIHNNQAKSIILSNHTTEGIYLQLERLSLSKFFDDILANEGIGLSHYEGKQARLESYLKNNNFILEDVVIIGDTIEEIRIGKNIGIKTIAITGGYNSASRLKKANPDVLVHKLPDILKLIKENKLWAT